MRPSWPDTPHLDFILVNRWERDIKAMAGEVHDSAFSDLPEALGKLDCMAGMLGELRRHLIRRESERQDRIAREERETATPPLAS